MFRGIGADYVPGLIVESVGKLIHVFLVGAFTIEAAAFA